MNPETLEALVIDRELGELSPEAADLLEAYLRLSPAARDGAAAMARTVGATREAVRRFPDLAPVPCVKPARAAYWTPWLAHAAAAVLMLGAGILIGQFAGRTPDAAPAPALAVRETPAGRSGNLWARYKVAYDARRGAYTIARNP